MILDEIVEYKRGFVAEAKRKVPLEEIKSAGENASPPLNFHSALCNTAESVRIIAEVKKASPSRGVIRSDFNPIKIARRYAECGAAAISVLTDEKYFSGSLEHLRAIRNAVSLPILRKEFIIDEYQIYEARAAGADAVLLIVAILDDAALGSFYGLARRLGMSALIEVHTDAELKRALKISPRIIGINNRNLKTFTVDLEQTARLRRMIPDGICVVSESGIKGAEDIAYLARQRVQAVLIGEMLMRAEDPGQALLTIIATLVV